MPNRICIACVRENKVFYDKNEKCLRLLVQNVLTRGITFLLIAPNEQKYLPSLTIEIVYIHFQSFIQRVKYSNLF